MHDYYNLRVDISLDDEYKKLDKFENTCEKFFKMLDKIKDVEEPEIKKEYSFIISEGRIKINVMKLKTLTSNYKLFKAIKYLQKHINYQKSSTIGSLYISHNQKNMDLIAVDNKIYFSTFVEKEGEREQLVQDADGKQVSFKFSDENMEISPEVREINVSLAHYDLTQKDRLTK